MTAAEHEMIVADPAKPRRYTWNGNPADQDEVRQVFDEVMGTGYYMATRTTDVPRKLEQIDEFDPEASTIIVAPALKGG